MAHKYLVITITIIYNFFVLFSAAWVHRGFSDDVTELSTVQPGADLITDFQKDKFRHFFFHVLDLNSDCVISSEDFEKLNEVFSIRLGCFVIKNNKLYLLIRICHCSSVENVNIRKLKHFQIKLKIFRLLKV